jgi:hypothetical protein
MEFSFVLLASMPGETTNSCKVKVLKIRDLGKHQGPRHRTPHICSAELQLYMTRRGGAGKGCNAYFGSFDH